MPQGYLLFHLNLAFSSIKTEAHPEVIQKCYWPLLNLIERRDLPIGIELTGWTLSQIAELDPAWVAKFKSLLQQGRCELIGSGWTQMIGPLVPAEVNQWNQRLGREAYQAHLGLLPKIVLVNEMVFSSGMVDIYREAGYEGLVMDRDNVRLALGQTSTPITSTPTHALGCQGQSLPVLWGDSILFQSLQRVVHGDKSMAEYLAYVRKRADKDGTILPIYCNDAEIFDYRPGRFKTEAQLQEPVEWARLEQVCDRLQSELGLRWLSPSQALIAAQQNRPKDARQLSSIAHPVPVKKQAKYNLNRWAVTGRNDLFLNSTCHQLCKALLSRPTPAQQQDDTDWRELCELWASDLRTHITEPRWQKAMARLQALCAKLDLADPSLATSSSKEADANDSQWQSLDTVVPPEGLRIEAEECGIYLRVESKAIRLRLNMRRGLAIDALAFQSDQFVPMLGSLPQGYFDSIEYGADFYTGVVLLEAPVKRERVADLEWVEPQFSCDAGRMLIRVRLPFAGGVLEKQLSLDAHSETLRTSYEFMDLQRPMGTLRVSILTFLNDNLVPPLTIACRQGSFGVEEFVLDREARHDAPASVLVSSLSGFGATDGELRIGDSRGPRLLLSWDPAVCAAMPMLSHLHASPRDFTHLKFSLCELDDTVREGGTLRRFELDISRAQP
ncbi:hypothetical protein [Roseateles sp.]|uniref:hypothetical protein n=1 Tax=Roseateles sp. TaxID=1971397 RepID=UPI003BA77660